MAIKAIEARYAGCRFRSRLEARWAVFLDEMGIKWQYEPEGFHTPAGPYLPDFRVDSPFTRDGDRGAGLTVYLEVKGAPLTLPDAEKIRAFAEASGSDQWICALGDIPEPKFSGLGFMVGWGDGGRSGRFNIYRGLIELGYRFDAFSGPTNPRRMSFTNGGAGASWGSVNLALTAARSARFEHGESGVR